MQIWLHAATKAKLVRQVRVQKEEVLFRCHTTWENGRLPSQRPYTLPAKARHSYRDREGRAVFLYDYLASFWHAQVLSIHLSNFWCSQCKNLPCHPFDQ